MAPAACGQAMEVGAIAETVVEGASQVFVLLSHNIFIIFIKLAKSLS